VADPVRETERFIRSSGLFGRRRPLLVGRGATALMLLYEALGPDGGRVILPAIGCPSLLASVLLTGRKPVIVDVDRNLNIDPDRVADIIRPNDLVLAVHIFGIPCDILKLKKICAENGAILVEDAAQAVGGRIRKRPVGTFGTASIVSFAAGKILPTHGGGLILIDDDKLFDKLAEKAAALPKRPDDLAVRSRELRDILTEAFNEARRDNARAASRWASVYRDYADIYRYRIEPHETAEITAALRVLADMPAGRMRGVAAYRKHLDGAGIEHVEYPAACSPFRFTFILPGLTGTQVQEVTEAIRMVGMHASNLYLPLHWLAPEEVEVGPCPRAEQAGTRLINLWLEDGIPERDAERVSSIVRKWTG